MNQVATSISSFDRAYFIGIGGIGMSALARYFNAKGWKVAGYDKTPSPLTKTLESEGISIHYTDLGKNIPSDFTDTHKTLVIYTPAIPQDMGELNHVQNSNFKVYKRAQVLGMITRDSKALGVAGTHGKTTTSTMLAHIMDNSSLKCNAFLGGISTNFNSNFVSNPESEYTVIEADEFDRSFLQLSPFASIVTSTDADHLDIYGDNTIFLKGFQDYVNLINPQGSFIHHASVKLNGKNKISYGIDTDTDYVGKNLRFEQGKFLFDVTTPTETLPIELGIPGIHNAENAIACIALCQQLGLTNQEITESLKSFQGVKRRFEYHIKSDELTYIDDYAHHPTEIEALISSIRLLYPNKKITGIFQPHLFTRTRDFFDGFAEQLSRLDEAILLPIYPARELPIEGITSQALLSKITHQKASVLTPQEAIQKVSQQNNEIVLTIGAGDIDRIVEPLKIALQDT